MKKMTVDAMVDELMEANKNMDGVYRFVARLSDEEIIELARLFECDLSGCEGNLIETLVRSLKGEETQAKPVKKATKSVKEALFEMYAEKPYQIFYRICELRRATGLSREEFDRQIKAHRDAEVVQVHQGDVTCMTPEDVRDCFVDENGFRMGTITLYGPWLAAAQKAS